jgi:hypothetical protein
MKIKALILWHYYNADGVISNASSTMFEGTPDELNTRIEENFAANNKERKGLGGYVIPHQILIFNPNTP